jgi:hypothetical protein
MSRNNCDLREGGTMSTFKGSFLEWFIARISRGSVPVDGGYWVDSPALRHAANASSNSRRTRMTSLNAQPLTRQHCH